MGTRFVAAAAAVGMIGAAACTGGPGPLPGQTSSSSQTTSGGSSGILSSSSSGSSGTSSSSSSTSSTSSSTSSGSPDTPTSISASDFSQACETATDCIAIYEGDVCSSCPCPNAAIAKTDEAKYASEFSTDRQGANCKPTGVACTQCASATVTCNAGTCGVTTTTR